MKKLIFKCIGMMVVFLGMSNYMLYLMTGKSPFDSFKLPDFAGSVKEFTPAKKQTVYKWVDSNGVTQYSSEPPNEGIAETLEVDPNMNLMQSIELPEQEKAEEAPTAALPQGPIYSPETVKKLMDDAKNVETLLQDRFDKQEKALENL